MDALTISNKLAAFNDAVLSNKNKEEVLKLGQEVCKACTDVAINVARHYANYCEK